MVSNTSARRCCHPPIVLFKRITIYPRNFTVEYYKTSVNINIQITKQIYVFIEK